MKAWDWGKSGSKRRRPGPIHLALAGVVALSLLGPSGTPPAAAQGGLSPPSAAPERLAASLLAQDGVRVSYHSGTGKVRFVGADPARPIHQPAILPASASGEDAARGFLAAYGALFGLTNPAGELILKSERLTERGRTVTRFQQVYQGIPVVGGELIVHTVAGGNVLSASGEILPDIAVDTTPSIGAGQAQQSALEAVAKWHGVDASSLVAGQPELWIYNPVLLRPGDGQTRLVWRLEVGAAGLLPIRELVLIDAQRGGIALHFNQVDMAVPLGEPEAPLSGPWYVAPGGDDSHDCLSPGTACATINAAIGKATAGDTVYVAIGTYTGTGDRVVLINKNITLSGGWDSSFTSQEGMSVIDGQLRREVVRINSGVTAVVERVVVQHGYGSGSSSGLINGGTTTLISSAVRNNYKQGVTSFGASLTLINSAVTGNRGRSGSGIYVSSGSVVLNNSTISGNIASGSNGVGGGIEVAGGSLTLNNSTVSNNTAYLAGGGIYSTGIVTLTNSIVAGNLAATGPDCVGPIASSGYNLVGTTEGCTFAAGAGDLIDADPGLGWLIGSPGYHPLVSGSPAIDGGNPAGCFGSTGLLAADQRGAERHL